MVSLGLGFCSVRVLFAFCLLSVCVLFVFGLCVFAVLVVFFVSCFVSGLWIASACAELSAVVSVGVL